MKKLLIQRNWCKGCRICTDCCPKGVLNLDAEGKAYVEHPDKCTFCRLCELRCPDIAIEVTEEADAAVEGGHGPEKPQRKKA